MSTEKNNIEESERREMTTDPLATILDNEVVSALHDWLGEDGRGFFRDLYDKYGTLNAVYPEPDCPQLPHAVHFRQGMQVRNFLRRKLSEIAESYGAEFVEKSIELDDVWIPATMASCGIATVKQLTDARDDD